MKVGVFFKNARPESGGTYTFIWEIIEALLALSQKSQHEFFLLTFDDRLSQNIKDFPQNDRVKVIFLPSLGEEVTANSRGWLERIFGKFERKTPAFPSPSDLVPKAIQEYAIEFIWYLTPISCPTSEIPYITIVWDLQHRLQPFFPEVSNNGEWEKREQKYRACLQRATAIITGNEAGREEVATFYQIPKDRILQLPHPTPQFALNADFQESAEILKQYQLPPNYLFYPAQFWPHKNHATLLFAIDLLYKEFNLEFPVVFAGSDRGNNVHIQGLVEKLGLQNRVFFLGFVSREELIALYQNAFALTYVSFFGPENLPPLEAFALGCPVIASKVSGAEEQFGEAALLFEPDNARDLAIAIQSLYNDTSLRQQLIQRGRQRAREWTSADFVRGVFSFLDRFATIRRCWS